MPLPSSTMVEVGVRMLCVQRGLGVVFLVVVVLLESHSAMRGVIFQRTVVTLSDWAIGDFVELLWW